MKKAFVAAALVWASGSFAQDGGAAASKPSVSKKDNTPVVKKPMILGISHPYGDEQAKKTKALAEPYLSKALGSELTIEIFPTYDDLSVAVATGKVHLAWITPLAFVQATKQNVDVTALAKAMREGGGLSYRAAFVVKKDNPAKALADLKGKKIAWVNKSSTSGYLFTRELLRKEGFEPDTFFSSEVFAGDHASVCKAVREGTADVGATFAAEPPPDQQPKADGCADSGPVGDFKVVASTGELPNEVLAASPVFDSRRSDEVISTFAKMTKSPEGKKVLKEGFRLDAWVIAVEGDFAPVQELLRAKDAKPKIAPAPADLAPEKKEKKEKPEKKPKQTK